MKKTMLFLYFIVSLFPTSLDKFQALMVNKQFDVHGIFYKYDFANIESAWDFVYVADNVYHQLKGDKATSNNIFGWKIIDEVVVSDPSFYFVYLFDIDEDNQTKYDWVALDKKASTINKIVGSTDKGYFAWSDTLNKLSFSFSKDNKKVTFHKAIDGGSSTDGQQLPKFPDLPDRLLDVGDTGNNPNTDDNKTDDNKTDEIQKMTLKKMMIKQMIKRKMMIQKMTLKKMIAIRMMIIAPLMSMILGTEHLLLVYVSERNKRKIK